MIDYTNLRHKGFLVDVRPLSLRDSTDWTTHVYICRDTRDAIELVQKVEMGNRSKCEEEAIKVGVFEATRLINSY